jgi:hypothetical protein
MCATAISLGTSCIRYAPRADGSRASLACAVRALRLTARGLSLLVPWVAFSCARQARVLLFSALLVFVRSDERPCKQGSYMGGLGAYVSKAQAQARAEERKELLFFISTDDAAVLDEVQFRALACSSPGGGVVPAIVRAQACASRSQPDQVSASGLRAVWDGEEPRYNGTHVFAPPGVSEKKWPGFPGNDASVDSVRLPAPRGVVDRAHRWLATRQAAQPRVRGGGGRVVCCIRIL